MAEETPELRRLPLRCVPEADESFSGFIVRLVERNGMDRLDEITKPVGVFSMPVFVPSPREVQALAALSGVPAETLRAMCGVGASGPWPEAITTVRGIEIPVAWFFAARRACPRCLGESSHHRIHWDIGYVRCCVRHGCELIQSCPGCGTRLDWKRPSLRRCRCGYDLAAAPAAERPADHVRAAKWIWDPVLGFGQHPPRMLASVSFARAVEIAGLTGEMLLAVRSGAAAFPPSLDGEGCLAAGYAALDHDVDGLHDAIQNALAKPKRLRTLAALDSLGRRCEQVQGAEFFTALSEMILDEARITTAAEGARPGKGD